MTDEFILGEPDPRPHAPEPPRPGWERCDVGEGYVEYNQITLEVAADGDPPRTWKISMARAGGWMGERGDDEDYHPDDLHARENLAAMMEHLEKVP